MHGEDGGMSAGRVAGIAAADSDGDEGELLESADRGGVSTHRRGQLCVSKGRAADEGFGTGARENRSS